MKRVGVGVGLLGVFSSVMSRVLVRVMVRVEIIDRVKVLDRVRVRVWALKRPYFRPKLSIELRF